jgi:Ser/Thr protein kinase RdoA (MazF antagonist)
VDSSVREALRQFGIEGAELVRFERGHTNATYLVRAASGQFALRRSWRAKSREQLVREERALAALSARPVPRIIPTTDGRPSVVEDDHALHLFTLCAGEPGPAWLPLDPAGQARIVAAMTELATIHRLLSSVPAAEVERWHWIAERLERVRSRESRMLPSGTARVLDRITTLLAIPLGLDAKAQWLHGDYHLGNLLWEEDRVTGVVDFDEVGCGAALGEVAMALFALARQDAGEARFAYDGASWRAGLRAYVEASGVGHGLEPCEELELLFCGYQVLIHLEAAQRELWALTDGIGFWPCFNRLAS